MIRFLLGLAAIFAITACTGGGGGSRGPDRPAGDHENEETGATAGPCGADLNINTPSELARRTLSLRRTCGLSVEEMIALLPP